MCPEFVNRINSRNPIWSKEDVLNNHQSSEVHTHFDEKNGDCQATLTKKHDFLTKPEEAGLCKKDSEGGGGGSQGLVVTVRHLRRHAG